MAKQWKHIQVSHEGGVVLVRLLDKHILDELVIREIGEELDQVLAEAPSPHMVLDFSDVVHLSSESVAATQISDHLCRGISRRPARSPSLLRGQAHCSARDQAV